MYTVSVTPEERSGGLNEDPSLPSWSKINFDSILEMKTEWINQDHP